MKTYIVATVMLMMGVQPSLADPWATASSFRDGVMTHRAFAVDPDTGYRITYSCSSVPSSGAIAIIGPELFEDGASYAPEVPVVLTVDAESYDAMPFEFARNPNGYLEVRKVEDSSEAEFAALVDILGFAHTYVGVTYFDKDLMFSAEGAMEAVLNTRLGCDQP